MMRTIAVLAVCSLSLSAWAATPFPKPKASTKAETSTKAQSSVVAEAPQKRSFFSRMFGVGTEFRQAVIESNKLANKGNYVGAVGALSAVKPTGVVERVRLWFAKRNTINSATQSLAQAAMTGDHRGFHLIDQQLSKLKEEGQFHSLDSFQLFVVRKQLGPYLSTNANVVPALQLARPFNGMMPNFGSPQNPVRLTPLIQRVPRRPTPVTPIFQGVAAPAPTTPVILKPVKWPS